MSLNSTPSGERVHVGFFGRRNAGKSSVVNAVTGQDLSVVSDVLGTTTDPVSKAMELPPVGPVLIIDTPGYDDVGSLGEQRVARTKKILNKTDVAVLVVDAGVGITKSEQEFLNLFHEKEIPYLIVYNKIDLLKKLPQPQEHAFYVSALQKRNIEELKKRIAELAVIPEKENHLAADLVNTGDFVLLVTPIDKAAPKGRLILPQQQIIRDLLEAGAVPVVSRESEAAQTLHELGRTPKLVITDSQVFGRVAKEIPKEIPLTSFSILMARYKGTLPDAVRGAACIRLLKDGDTVLMAEGCTHHRQCEDIGTVKLPRWLSEYTGRKLQFTFSSGMEFPENLSSYRLIIHCGGCMLNEREMRCRMKCAVDAGVPMTNYGTAIAYMNGILKRSLELFPELQKLLSDSEEKS